MPDFGGTILNQGSLAEWPLAHLLNFVFRSTATGKLVFEPAAGEPVVLDLEEGRFVPPEGQFVVDVAGRVAKLFGDANAAFKVISIPSTRTDFFGENLDPRTLIYPGIRDAYDSARVDRELAPLADRTFSLVAGADAGIRDMGFSTEAGPVVDALRAPGTLAGLMKASAGREEQVKRVVLALFYAELVEVKGAATEAKAEVAVGRVALSASRVPVGNARRTAVAMAAQSAAPAAAPFTLADEASASALMPDLPPPGSASAPATPASGTADRPAPAPGSAKGELAFEKGRFALRKGDFALAEMAFAEAVAASPRPEFRAHYHAARLQNAANDKDKEAKAAVVELEAVVKEAPTLVFAHHLLGMCWKQLGQSAKAAECWKTVLKLDESHLEAHRELRLVTMRSRTMPAVTDAEARQGGRADAEGGAPPRKTGVPAGQKAVLAGLGIVLLVFVGMNLLGGESPPPAPPPPPPPTARKAAPVIAPPLVAAPAPSQQTGPRPAAVAAPPVDLIGLPVNRLKPGHLVLITNPSEADVWVAGKLRGRSPLVVDLPPGEVDLVVIKAGFASVRERVDISRGAEITKVLAPAGKVPRGDVGVKVRCKTENRFPVFVDGVDTGLLCPTERIDMTEGTHAIGILVPSTGQLKTVDERVDDRRGSKRVRFAD